RSAASRNGAALANARGATFRLVRCIWLLGIVFAFYLSTVHSEQTAAFPLEFCIRSLPAWISWQQFGWMDTAAPKLAQKVHIRSVSPPIDTRVHPQLRLK